MIFLFFTSPLAPLEAEICPIEVLYGISIVLQVGAVLQVAAFIILEHLIDSKIFCNNLHGSKKIIKKINELMRIMLYK